jgi:membrane-bound ClpP family serine protease
MKPIAAVGAVLLALGLLALLYQGINYTRRETIVEIGAFRATAERQRRLPIRPLVGVVAVIGGVALLVAGTRRA